MEKKECKPLTSEFIEYFLLEAQHHSGLQYLNAISVKFLQLLSHIAVADDLRLVFMDKLLNKYMIITHELYHKNKTWKSYDW